MSIKIEDLSYIYSENTAFEKRALDNISLTIDDGEFVGMIGHTGSGKSTLIQQVNGLLKPTSGSVYVNGVSITEDKLRLKEVRQQVGLVFQYPEHQLFEMTVYKDVAFGPKNMGLDSDVIDLRVKKALAIVGIGEELYEASPFDLSGGQKRRVAIAGVLAMEPSTLILDEPTAGLDPKGRDEILHEIKKLHDQLGITVILVSHSMEDIANYVDRVIVMDKGEIRLNGPVKEVFSEITQLESMGLAVPETSYLVRKLIEAGFDLPKNIIHIEEAVKHLVPLLHKEATND